MSEPSSRPNPKTDTVSVYVSEFQRRFVEFERGRQQEMRVMKHDFAARLFSDLVVFGNKRTYDGLLQGMLNEKEQQQLETDPRFTRAWRIFVDLCWLKKQVARAGLIVVAFVLLLAILGFLVWAFPHIAAPSRP
jgi:hypothetical protein